MTVVFGFVVPFMYLLANVTFGSVAFTVLSGAVLTAGLFAIAKFAPQKWVNFALAFLSVQCLLNAFFSLKRSIFHLRCGQPTNRRRQYGSRDRHSRNALGDIVDRHFCGCYYHRCKDVRLGQSRVG